MAAYDLEEQEQLATLKAWWTENGNLVMTALSLVVMVLAVWQGWNYYQRNQAARHRLCMTPCRRQPAPAN